jgi:HSP20 family protein
MAITTWNPLTELEALRREVERAFESCREERPWPFFRAPFLLGTTRAYPLVNMAEDKDNLYVEALAAGLNTENLDVTVQNGTLRISGEKMRVSEVIKTEAFHRNEREAGKFMRTIGLPIEVDADKVRAEYKDGLLTITLPKAEKAKPKQITVNVS